MRLRLILPFVAWASAVALTSAHASTYAFSTLNIAGADPTSVFGDIASGINNKGQVVGTVGTDFNAEQGFLLDLATGATTILTNPATPIGLLAKGINDAGQILADIAFTGGFETTRGGSVLIDPATGALTALYVNPPVSQASSVNDSGQIVGTINNAGRGNPNPTSQGFVRSTTTNTLTILAAPPAPTQTSAVAINDRGQVVGSYRVGSTSHGFLFDVTTGSFTTLDNPSGTSTLLSGINNLGQIIGSSMTNFTSTSFVLDLATGTYTALTAPGLLDLTALDINDAGQIVGYYRPSVSPIRAFLATPDIPTQVPEPASAAMLVTFILALGLVHRCQHHDRDADRRSVEV